MVSKQYLWYILFRRFCVCFVCVCVCVLFIGFIIINVVVGGVFYVVIFIPFYITALTFTCAQTHTESNGWLNVK